MIIKTEIQDQGATAFVTVFADQDPMPCGVLVMSTAGAAELVARIAAGEPPEVEVTPKVAAQVLYHYGLTGGMQAGSFITALITAMTKADRDHLLRLSTVYPAYAVAVYLARDTEHGRGWLQNVAKQRLVADASPADPAEETS
ncbi:hypothetical protein [Sphaerisporangium sp. TRM90804]|uniref:hypothetical protein n=1 Tax=Sphaerisporangium sp. TRM90804 TaxID=3031113 RepID=UPI00244C9E12|nr:hypothetical protein [Sphaerisporangium sp. TRM90804]MDH2425741.1 hypothetical protein [Sphaerisporangium sp. TRM90804]